MRGLPLETFRPRPGRGVLAVGLVMVLALVAATPAVADDADKERPPFPNVTLTPVGDGEPVQMDSFRGKPVLVTFWASWCGPCRMELPELQDLAEELEGTGFELVTVNVDTTERLATRFMEATRLSVPVYRMSQQDLVTIGVRSIPTNILLDPEGKAATVYEGYSAAVPEVIRELVRAMVAPPVSDDPG